MLSLASFVYATDTISSVLVKGLYNVELKTVLSTINVKKGEVYSANIAREKVRSISALDYFENIEVSFDDQRGILTFIVTEKPYINRVIFKGNSVFSTGKLKSTSVLKEKEYYDLSKLEETKNKILKLYSDKGYTDCQIEAYPTVDADTNKITITFIITENNKVVIGGVDVDGMFSFSTKKILKLMKTRPKKIFKEDIFQADLMTLQTFYKDNGFMDYQLLSSSIAYNESRTKMFLKVSISEGDRYKIGSVSYSGTFAISDKDIRKVIKLKKKQICNQDKINKIIRDIYSLYSDKGYLNAKIEPQFIKSSEFSGVMDINFSIQENAIVYIGNIYIDGLISTKDKTIRRELLLSSGDVFSLQKGHRSIEKIYNLGFIESVEIQHMPTGVQDVFDLSIAITEGKPAMITAGIGYSSVDKLVGSLQFRHLNLFGLAQRLSLSCEFGEHKSDYEVYWTNPRILNRNMSLTLSIFDINRKKDYVSMMSTKKAKKDYTIIENACEETRRGFSTEIGPQLSDHVKLMFRYTFEDIKLKVIEEDKKNDVIKQIKRDDVIKQIKRNNAMKQLKRDIDSSKSKVSSLSTQIVYDSRDYIFDPTKGNRQLLEFKTASNKLGGNVNFLRGIARSTWYFPTFWKFVLSANVELDAIRVYGVTNLLPIYEKSYSGPGNVRGYSYKSRVETGLCNNRKSEVRGVLNVEYKFPIFAEKGKSILVGAFFYDIGGSWENFNTIDKENLRSGVGFGIRITTPVFPIRFDWGYGLNHKKGEPLQDYYLSIGNAF
jgi:outer membrane protein insertion porin family